MPNCPNCKIWKKRRDIARHVASCRTFTSAAAGGGGSERAKVAVTEDVRKARDKRIEAEVGAKIQPMSHQKLQDIEREAGTILRDMKKAGKRRDR